MQFEFYKNILAINNYRQIKQLNSDLIELSKIKVIGKDLVVLKLSKDYIVIRGNILRLELGDALN